MTRRRKITKEHLEWRKEILARFDNKCAIHPCDKTKYLNAHHLVPQEFKEFQRCLNNGIALCPSHHELGKFSAHRNPIWFCKWLSKNHPELYWIAIDRLKKLDSSI